MRACIAKPLLFLRAVPPGGTAASASLPGHRRAGAVWVARTPLPPAAPLPLRLQLPQHGLQDAPVDEVGDLVRGVEPYRCLEGFLAAVVGTRGDGDGLGPAFVQLADVEALGAGQAQRAGALAGGE